MSPAENPSRPSETTQMAFISGPIEPWDDYFSEFYEPKLVAAINANHDFVIGPAPGIDTTCLNFFIQRGISPTRITAYLASFENHTLRPRLQWFELIGGHIKVEGTTTSDRDAAMTRDSDYDILRYMTIEEQKDYYGDMYYARVSATEKNERRRLGLPLHINHALNVQPAEPRDLTSRKKIGWKTRVQTHFQRIFGA